MRQLLGMRFAVLGILIPFSSCMEKEANWENGEVRKVLAATSWKNQYVTCAFYRLDDSYADPSNGGKGEPSLHGYGILSDEDFLTLGQRRQLSSILENPNTYFIPPEPPDCLFRPGVAFCFRGQKNKADLLVCFSCDELRFYLNGGIEVQSFFNPKGLASLVKELFPNDPKIQSLK